MPRDAKGSRSGQLGCTEVFLSLCLRWAVFPFVVFLMSLQTPPPPLSFSILLPNIWKKSEKLVPPALLPAPDVVRFPDVGCSALQMKGGMCSSQGWRLIPGLLSLHGKAE